MGPPTISWGGSCFPKANLRGGVSFLERSSGNVRPQPMNDVKEQICWVFGNDSFAFTKPLKAVKDNCSHATILMTATLQPCNHRDLAETKDGKSPRRRCKNRDPLTLSICQMCPSELEELTGLSSYGFHIKSENPQCRSREHTLLSPTSSVGRHH